MVSCVAQNCNVMWNNVVQCSLTKTLLTHFNDTGLISDAPDVVDVDCYLNVSFSDSSVLRMCK